MVKSKTSAAVAELIGRYPQLAVCEKSLLESVEIICRCFRAGGKLLVCGNGGSAADAEHIVGELMKGFLSPRTLAGQTADRLREICPAAEAEYLLQNLQGTLPAISLVNETALTTAFANDQAADLGFAQQVLGLGQEGDVLLGITTSGNSANVLYAMQVARAKGMKTIALTGASGGKVKALADVAVCAPEKETYKIQEYHLPIYHMLCIAAEREFFA